MKTKFGKNLKRVISAGLTAAMLASFAAFAPVTSFAAIKTENVLVSNDFATSVPGSDSNVATYTTDDAEHGGVMKLSAVSDEDKFVGFSVSQEAGKRVMIDFDFKVSSTDFMHRIMFNNGRNLGHIVFGPAGKLILSTNGATVWGNISTDGSTTPTNGLAVADYEANKWYRMTAVINPTGNKNAAVGHQTTVDYYLDGKHLLTSNTDFFKSSEANDPLLTNVFIGTSKTGNGYITEKGDVEFKYDGQYLLVDNLSIRYADTYTYLQNDDPVVENNSVKIKFSETLAAANTGDYTSGNDLSGIKVKSIDGKEATGVSATVKDEYLTVNYSKLDSGKTYYVVLPKNFKSVDEKVLESNAIPFTAPVSGEEMYVNSRSFKTSEIGLTNVSDYGEITSEKQIVDASQMGSGHEAALKVTSKVSDTKYVRYTQFDDANYGLSDEVVVYTDYYFDKLGRTGNITLINKPNANYGAYFFDSYGHFVVLTGVEWTAADCSNPQDYGNTVKAASDMIETGKWYTVKSIINQKDLTVTYYLGYIGEDNQYAEHYVTTAPVLSSKYAAGTTANHFGEIRIATLYGGDTEKWKFGEFYIDNIKVGYKNVNINPSNMLATAENTTNYDLSSVVVDKKLDDKYLVEADVKISDFAKPVYFRTNEKTTNEMGETVRKTSGLIFKADDNGNLYMSKSLLNWAADDYMTPLNVKINKNEQVNIKLLVNKNATKEVSVFVNDKYVRSLSLGWGNEGNGTYADTNVGADEFVYGDGNNAEGSIVKASIYNLTSNQPADIVLTDSTNKNYNIFDGAIPADIASVTVKYNTAFADGTNVSGAKLQAKGEDGVVTDVTDYTATLSDDKKSIVIGKEDGVLTNGTYVITISGVNGADDFKTEFTVNDSRNLTVTEFKISKDGTSYYPELKAKNYSTADKKFTVIICEYSNDNVPKLKNIGFKEVTVSGSGNMTINKTYADANGLTLTNVGENSTVKAFIWDSLGTNVPLLNAVPYVAE